MYICINIYIYVERQKDARKEKKEKENRKKKQTNKENSITPSKAKPFGPRGQVCGIDSSKRVKSVTRAHRHTHSLTILRSL